jgi:DnaJ-domain-containing protein 1
MIRFVFQRNSIRPRLCRSIGTGPDPTKDYYKEMDLSPGASHADVKRQYIKLVKQYHPDQNIGTPA